jgi:hypothetical protein
MDELALLNNELSVGEVIKNSKFKKICKKLSINLQKEVKELFSRVVNDPKILKKIIIRISNLLPEMFVGKNLLYNNNKPLSNNGGKKKTKKRKRKRKRKRKTKKYKQHGGGGEEMAFLCLAFACLVYVFKKLYDEENNINNRNNARYFMNDVSEHMGSLPYESIKN